MRPLARLWLVMLLAMTACVSAQSAGTEDGVMTTLAGTSWRLVELNEQPAIRIGDAGTPTLMFSAYGMRVSGNGGCNQFSGTYDQAGASLRFGPLASTRRACGEPEGNTQESAYLSALQSTNRYSVSGDTLVLYSGDQVVARFVRNEK